MKRQGGVSVALIVAAAAVTGGCEGATDADGAERVSLSFSANPAAQNVALQPITRNGHTLDITDVDVTFSELTLERAEGAVGGGDSDGESDADSDSDGSANERFRTGPVTVAFPVEGGVFTPINSALPLGVYEELEADIETVRLRGTYDGKSFDVLLPVHYEVEAELEPLFEVTSAADRLNLTVAFDVHEWFIDSGGLLVDPALLGTDTQLRTRLVTRIRNSFHAFEDSDRDADDADSDSDGGD